jgi:hypothetical protein
MDAALLGLSEHQAGVVVGPQSLFGVDQDGGREAELYAHDAQVVVDCVGEEGVRDGKGVAEGVEDEFGHRELIVVVGACVACVA